MPLENLLPPDSVRMIIQKTIIPRLARSDLSHAMLQGYSALMRVVAPVATTDTRRLPVHAGRSKR